MELFARLFVEMLSYSSGSDGLGSNAFLATLAVMGFILVLAAMAAAGS